MKGRITALIEKNLCIEKHKIQLTEKDIDLIESSFKKFKVHKGECLIKKDELERYMYIVEDGIFRYYTCNEIHQEDTFGFVVKDECLNPGCILTDDTRSLFNIQALCESIVWGVHRDVLFNICEESMAINSIKRILVEYFAKKQSKRLLLFKLPPKDRYLYLLENEKDLVQQIPLKYLASYIGIASPSLSRIRNRLIKLSLL